MSLVGPWLSTVGKKKGKFKWASADAKRKDAELRQEWEKKKAEIDKTAKVIQSRPLTRPFPKLGPPPGRETRYIPSLDTGAGVGAKKENPVYTGDKVLGVSIVHKSCLQPVFTSDQAKELASMRR